jgi:hypothetical protein
MPRPASPQVATCTLATGDVLAAGGECPLQQQPAAPAGVKITVKDGFLDESSVASLLESAPSNQPTFRTSVAAPASLARRLREWVGQAPGQGQGSTAAAAEEEEEEVLPLTGYEGPGHAHKDRFPERAAGAGPRGAGVAVGTGTDALPTTQHRRGAQVGAAGRHHYVGCTVPCLAGSLGSPSALATSISHARSSLGGVDAVRGCPGDGVLVGAVSPPPLEPLPLWKSHARPMPA